MPIVFEDELRQFFLFTAHTTLSFGITPNNRIMSLYYGKKIRPTSLWRMWHPEASSFTPHSADAPDGRYALDEIPTEYPAYGCGDFHEAALGVEFPNGSRLVDLCYMSHRILHDTPEPAGLPGLSDGDDTLQLTLCDNVTGLTVNLYYSLFEQADVIARYAVISNTTGQPLRITRALSANLDLPTADYDWITLYGYHLEEAQISRTPLHHGVQSIGSRRGASSHNYNPAVMLAGHHTTENTGDAYGMTLIYSGNFIARAEVDGFNRTRLQIGIHPDDFRWTLHTGEQFVTPQAVMSFSGNGLNGVSQNFYRIIKNNLGHTVWRNRARPIVINSWEAAYFDFDEEKLLSIIRSCNGLGIDTFVLDDGWFGGKKTCRFDDTSSLGDWFVAPQKLPHGLDPLIEECEKQGMAFGLWFEPEMVSVDSDLFRMHPDWAIHMEERPYCLGRCQLILDITREDVYQYLEERLAELLSEHRISYIKWDMNRHMTDAYSAVLSPEHQPELFHRYILQLYRLLNSVTSKFPHILIEGCSGGGGRFDMGMLYYCPQIWTSDDSEAIERLRIQYGTSLFYPPQAMTAHLSLCPNHQTKRITPFFTRAAVAMSTIFGYELDPQTLPEEDRKAIADQTARYHVLQPVIMEGDFYRLENPFEQPYCAWMVVAADKRRAIVTFVRQLHRPRSRTIIRLQGLDPDAVYLLKRPDGSVENTCGGDELMAVGISIAVQEDYAAKVFDLEMIK